MASLRQATLFKSTYKAHNVLIIPHCSGIVNHHFPLIMTKFYPVFQSRVIMSCLIRSTPSVLRAFTREPAIV